MIKANSRFKDHFEAGDKPVAYDIALGLHKGHRVQNLTVRITSSDLQHTINYLKTVRFHEYDSVEIKTVNGMDYNENLNANTIPKTN